MAKMTLDELVAQLQKAFGDGLAAVVLYGSAAAGEHIPKRSDYNVLVIVRALGLAELEREAAIARAWGEAGNPPPLTLTEARVALVERRVPDGVRRCPRAAPRAVRHAALRWDLGVDRATCGCSSSTRRWESCSQLRQGMLAAGGDRKRQRRAAGGEPEHLHGDLSCGAALSRRVAAHGLRAAGERGRGAHRDGWCAVRARRSSSSRERAASGDARCSRCSPAIWPARTRWLTTSTDLRIRHETNDARAGAGAPLRVPLRQEGRAAAAGAGHDPRGPERREDGHARGGAGHVQAARVREARQRR